MRTDRRDIRNPYRLVAIGIAGASLGIIDDVLRHVGSMSATASFLAACGLWVVCVCLPMALLDWSQSWSKAERVERRAPSSNGPVARR